MANDYIMVGHTVTGGAITDGKKLTILEESPETNTPVEVNDGTLDGNTAISFGISKRVWRMTALVYYSSAPIGYASLGDVRGWFEDTTATGNQYKFQDLETSTIYDVVLLNKGAYKPTSRGVVRYSSGAIWEVPLEFMQV